MSKNNKRKQPTDNELLRWEINKRMIGEEVFVITHGGFYAQVEEVEGDEFGVRCGDYFNWVNIHEIRQPKYFV